MKQSAPAVDESKVALEWWRRLPEWLELTAPDEFLQTVKNELKGFGLYLRLSDSSEPADVTGKVLKCKEDGFELELVIAERDDLEITGHYHGLLAWVAARYARLCEQKHRDFNRRADGFLSDFLDRYDAFGSAVTPHLLASVLAEVSVRHFNQEISSFVFYSEGKAREVFGDGVVGGIPDADKFEQQDFPLLLKEKSYWFPIYTDNRLVAAVAYQERFWPAGQVKYLVDVFNCIGTRLSGITDSEAPRHRVYELGQVIDLTSDHLRTSRGLDYIIQSYVDIIFEVFDCDVCRLFWRESEHELKLRASTPPSDEKDSIIIEEDPLIESVINESKGVLINNVPTAQKNRGRDEGFRSFIAVPLRFKDRVIGTVNISSERANSYTEEQLARLSSFCDRLAGIYSIAQDFANLTAYVEELLLELPVGVINIRFGPSEVILNPVARQLLSITTGRLPQDEFIERIKDLGSEELASLVEEAKEAELVGPEDIEIAADQTHPTVISALRSTVQNVSGEVIGAIIVLADVTEQRLLNRQMSRTERLTALGELASSLAHEIKTPLTSIHGFAQMIPKKMDQPDFLERMSKIVQKEADRLNSLVENLLSFGKPQVEVKSRVNIEEIIDDVRVLVDKKIEKKRAQLKVELPAQLSVMGDGDKLKQVFINLLLNALDAVNPGGEIIVRGQEADKRFVKVEVIDDGEGMEPEMLNKIFNPFFTTKSEGSGLGLAITHRIIEEHGGELEVSSSPGEGTEVSILLPVYEADER